MTDWTLAKCLQGDPDMWFPDHGDSAEHAKFWCRRCPIRRDCLDVALRNREQHGVWGGVVAQDLHRIRKGRLSVEAALARTDMRRAA